MSLLSIFNIAGSALNAQSQRMNVAASNMANADSVVGPDGQPYRARQVVFQVDPAPNQALGQKSAACAWLAWSRTRRRSRWSTTPSIRWPIRRATSACPTWIRWPRR